MTDRSSRHNAGNGPGFVAFRYGDAVRVDMYIGRTKAKNVAYYLDATTWPAERIDRVNMAHFMFRNPTLLAGPSLRGDRPQFWAGDTVRYAEAIAGAVDEVAL